jgi:hypothetical protein
VFDRHGDLFLPNMASDWKAAATPLRPPKFVDEDALVVFAFIVRDGDSYLETPTCTR